MQKIIKKCVKGQEACTLFALLETDDIETKHELISFLEAPSGGSVARLILDLSEKIFFVRR